MTTFRPRSSGFTLLEVLVAIVLLGLVATLLSGGLRFGTRVWQRGEDHLQALAGMQSVHAVLRRELAQVAPVSALGDDSGWIAFEGMPTYVRFVGVAPAEVMIGGDYDITIGVSYDDVARHLVMAWRLLAESMPGDVSAPERDQVLLLRDVKDVSFAFFGADEGDAPQWHEMWVERTTLPLLVRVSVSFPDGDRRRWPVLVVAPMLRLPVD